MYYLCIRFWPKHPIVGPNAKNSKVLNGVPDINQAIGCLWWEEWKTHCKIWGPQKQLQNWFGGERRQSCALCRPAASDSTICRTRKESCLSGRKSHTRNVVYALRRTGGSNPSLSARKFGKPDRQTWKMRVVWLSFFCASPRPRYRLAYKRGPELVQNDGR